MTSAGDCQRDECGLPLVIVKQAEKMFLLHVHETESAIVRRRPGLNGCREPVPLHGEP